MHFLLVNHLGPGMMISTSHHCITSSTGDKNLTQNLLVIKSRWKQNYTCDGRKLGKRLVAISCQQSSLDI